MSGKPQAGLERVGGHSRRSGTVGGPSVRCWTGRGNLGEVREGQWEPWGGLRRVRGPSGGSRTGRGTLG